MCIYRFSRPILYIQVLSGGFDFDPVYTFLYMNILILRIDLAVTFCCIFVIIYKIYKWELRHAETLPDTLVSCVGKLMCKNWWWKKSDRKNIFFRREILFQKIFCDFFEKSKFQNQQNLRIFENLKNIFLKLKFLHEKKYFFDRIFFIINFCTSAFQRN